MGSLKPTSANPVLLDRVDFGSGLMDKFNKGQANFKTVLQACDMFYGSALPGLLDVELNFPRLLRLE